MKKLSIIYDVTSLCPWNCSICCMGATSCKECLKNELTLDQKLDVVRQVKELSLNGYDVRVDLSGGEIFTNISDHKVLIKALSEAIGNDKVGISCSGINIDENLAGFLGRTVSDVEMTMDTPPHVHYDRRPDRYSIIAGEAVPLLKKAGIRVGLQTVVGACNSSRENAQAIFSWCCENSVDDWSILKFFASGRGARFQDDVMSDTECANYVHMVQEMVSRSDAPHKPKVDFHYLMPGHEKYNGECRCVRHSIGILPDGKVVACFWALDSTTNAIAPKYLLGNVTENSLLEILNGERARYWNDCPHCCELA